MPATPAPMKASFIAEILAAWDAATPEARQEAMALVRSKTTDNPAPKGAGKGRGA